MSWGDERENGRVAGRGRPLKDRLRGAGRDRAQGAHEKGGGRASGGPKEGRRRGSGARTQKRCDVHRILLFPPLPRSHTPSLSP